MKRLMLAAPCSGSGKTAVTCALLAALRERGMKVGAFKCGPDYIDPMFHRAVLGVDGCNLDLFLSSEDRMRSLFASAAEGLDVAVCEGAMGFYDGVGGGTTRASAWHVADTLDMPAILVVRPKGVGLTLAAQLKGLLAFRENSHIAAIILNDCTKMLFRTLGPMLERETGVPVLGFLPHVEQAEIKSRHLGLYTAREITDLQARIALLKTELTQHVDLDKLLSLCEDKADILVSNHEAKHRKNVKIAVASDPAFCFCYRETLLALEQAGAEAVPFSPMEDAALPKGVSGLYLPGGYPELYARKLSENRTMLASIRSAAAHAMPVVAECGGFLYLGASLTDAEGVSWPMAGVLPGAGYPTGRLCRFGYATLTAREDSLLFRAGQPIPVHEFHHWDCTENGAALHAEKPVSGRSWDCGFVSPTMYAGFPHLYFAGQPELAARFVSAAERYAR